MVSCVFPNSCLFLLKPAKALEEGVFRDIRASQVPLSKGTHWGKSVPLGHSPAFPPHNHYQVCWSSTLSSSEHPAASVHGESGWCQGQMTSHLALSVCPGSSTKEWLRGSCGSLGDGGAVSHHRLYLPCPNCRQDTGIQPRPNPNM